MDFEATVDKNGSLSWRTLWMRPKTLKSAHGGLDV